MHSIENTKGMSKPINKNLLVANYFIIGLLLIFVNSWLMMKSGYSYTSYLQFTGEPKSFTYHLLTQIAFILLHGLIGIGTSLVIKQNIHLFYYLVSIIWIRFPFVIISALLYIEPYFPWGNFEVLNSFEFPNLIIFILVFISITYILFLLFQVCRKTFRLPFHLLFPLFLIQLIILEWGSLVLLKFT